MDSGVTNYRRFLAGDDNGIVEIIKQYKDGLILFINSYVHNISVAEELAEDTFYRLVIKKPSFTEEYSFKTWLYTIGRNQAISQKRYEKRVQLCCLSEQEQYDTKTLEDTYIAQEQKIQLHRALGYLKPLYSEVLYLAYFEALTNGEIAHIMKRNKRQIENLLYRAKQALRIELEKEGFVYEKL